MRYLVSDKRVVVDVLLLISDHTTVALTLGTLTRKSQVELVAGDAVVQSDDIVVHPTVSLLVDIDIAQAHILIMGLFEAIEIERGILTNIGLNHLCGEEVTVVSSMVAEKHLNFGTLFENDEYATVDHETG